MRAAAKKTNIYLYIYIYIHIFDPIYKDDTVGAFLVTLPASRGQCPVSLAAHMGRRCSGPG